MGAIYKRELKAHLTTLFGWIYIAVSIGLIGVSVITTNLVSAVPQIEYGISLLVMSTILTIPFLCMSIFAPENKSGNIKFLLSLPIKTHNIVLGKYLAALTMLAIPTLVLAVMPLLLSIYGNVLLAQSYASIFAYFLVGAVTIAICMFIGANSRSSVLSCIIGALVLALLYSGTILSAYIPTSPIASLVAIVVLEIIICLIIWLVSEKLTIGSISLGVFLIPTAIAYLVSPVSFSSLFHRIFRFLSPFEKISKFSLGIFDIKDVIYLVSVAAFFVFLSCAVIEKGRISGRRTNKKSALVVAASTILIVAINLGVFSIPTAFTSFDASGLGIYSLSDVSKEYASKADEDISIFLLSERGIPDPQIEQVIMEYKATNPHIDYKLINVTADPDFVEKYIGVSYYHVNGDGIRPLSNNSIIIESAKRHIVINSSTYYSYKVGSYRYTEDEFLAFCQQLTSEGYDVSQIGYDTFFDLDSVIASGLEYVTLENVSTIFTLKGHGELPVDESFYSSLKYSQTGALDELLLDNFDAIPAYCSALVISAPQTDISSTDADKIIEYLERGGDVILITSPENVQMPNLMRVTEFFGLTAQNGVINDSDKDHHTNYNNTYLVPDVNLEHPAVSFVSSSKPSSDGDDIKPRIPNAHPIIKTQPEDTEFVIREIFTTSEKATAADNDHPKKFVIAYSSQKMIDKETENTANMFWFSSYEAFSPKIAETHSINIVYLLVSVSYMGGAQSFQSSLDVEEKSISGSFLKVPTSIPVVWSIAFGLITLIILCSGIALYISRRGRKRF